jgi:hypothetical protein
MSDSGDESKPPIAKKIKVEPPENEDEVGHSVKNGSNAVVGDGKVVDDGDNGNGVQITGEVNKIDPDEGLLQGVKKEEDFDDDDEVVMPIIRPKKDDHSLSRKKE